MVAVSYSRLPEGLARSLLANQKDYSDGQKRMAMDSPHLVWVRPKNRTLPRALRMAIYDRDKGVCAYCDERLPKHDFTVDHIEPVALGGSDDPENLTVACRSCNSSKGARV